MNWIPLTSEAQLDAIKLQSLEKPIVIFKHSTRCSISTVAKSRLERAVQPAGIDFYYLDLLAYRPISNIVSEMFSVHHESPQILLIKNAECSYEETHNGIDMDDLIAQL